MSFLNQLVAQGKLAQEAAAAIEQEAADTGRSLEDVARDAAAAESKRRRTGACPGNLL